MLLVVEWPAVEGGSNYYGGMACEQESGAGVTGRLLDDETQCMRETAPFWGSKPNRVEGPMPPGIELHENQRTKGERPGRDKAGHTIGSRGGRPQRNYKW